MRPQRLYQLALLDLGRRQYSTTMFRALQTFSSRRRVRTEKKPSWLHTSDIEFLPVILPEIFLLSGKTSALQKYNVGEE